MTQADFEADLRRDGYEIVPREMAANQFNDTHAHGFDARVYVLAGEMTVTRDGASHTYRPGEQFAMPAGCQHAEQAGAAGCRYVAGRRAAR